MHRRLQVFISSTYQDLVPERQAAVEAILSAGNIPAGMELFAAGSESQLEVVKRWIDQSDVYMLILGGRYGSIEPKSGKSYTQIEYEYAVEKSIPLFAVVTTEPALDKKVRKSGKMMVETENTKALKEFRANVLSRICRFFDDPKDIKLAIHETLAELQRTHTFSGWVSGRDAQQPAALLEQLSALVEDNRKLRTALDAQTAKAARVPPLAMGRSFDELLNLLRDLKFRLPPSLAGDNQPDDLLLNIFRNYRGQFATGVTNQSGVDEVELLLYTVAQELLPFGLTEHRKVPTAARWSKLATTKAGNEFLTELEVRLNAIRDPEKARREESAQR